MKTIAFFNNKGGGGKTTLVYHLAHMLADMGKRVLVADIDPQANLTAMFEPEGELLKLWSGNGDNTIYDAVLPLSTGKSDIREGLQQQKGDYLFLLAGDLRLSRFEDSLSDTWAKCLEDNEDQARAFRVQTAFARLLHAASEEVDYALVDIGPNLGAINRSALLACDYVVTPLSPDLFSWQGLINFGGQLQRWHSAWEYRKTLVPSLLKEEGIFIPQGTMRPLGYIVMRYNIRKDRPTQSFEHWINKMPQAFRKLLLDGERKKKIPPVGEDPYNLATIKDYFSLMPMAQEAHKPMFRLKPGDGAIASNQSAVRRCYQDFKTLAEEIIKRADADK